MVVVAAVGVIIMFVVEVVVIEGTCKSINLQ